MLDVLVFCSNCDCADQVAVAVTQVPPSSEGQMLSVSTDTHSLELELAGVEPFPWRSWQSCSAVRVEHCPPAED